jgi:hypothetical protein
MEDFCEMVAGFCAPSLLVRLSSRTKTSMRGELGSSCRSGSTKKCSVVTSPPGRVLTTPTRCSTCMCIVFHVHITYTYIQIIHTYIEYIYMCVCVYIYILQVCVCLCVCVCVCVCSILYIVYM